MLVKIAKKIRLDEDNFNFPPKRLEDFERLFLF